MKTATKAPRAMLKASSFHCLGLPRVRHLIRATEGGFNVTLKDLQIRLLHAGYGATPLLHQLLLLDIRQNDLQKGRLSQTTSSRPLGRNRITLSEDRSGTVASVL